MITIVTAAKLKRDAQEFLRFKRAMGIRYRRAEFVLDAFVLKLNGNPTQH